MRYEDILEAVQLVSAAEVINCLIFCLHPWNGTQQNKISTGFVNFAAFPR